MTGLILRIASFNRSSTSLLLLVLNAFLKVKAVYFKVDSTIFRCQCSTYSAGAPRTCTSSTINFLGAEGPFLDEVGSSRVIWCNCCLAECVGAFSQLLKCFSKLLTWLIVFLQWGGHFFLFDGRFTVLLLQPSFVGKKSCTPLAFVVCSLDQTFCWSLNLPQFFFSRGKLGFKLIIG